PTSSVFSPLSLHDALPILVADALILTLLLYLSGGATNPFVSYYLVPITIAAITLPRGLTLAIGLLCVAAYGGLLFWHVAVPALRSEEHTSELQSRENLVCR